jgi:hypothetical protein
VTSDARPVLRILTVGLSAQMYPKWDDFQAVRQHVDPSGRFLNGYLKRVLGVNVAASAVSTEQTGLAGESAIGSGGDVKFD